MRELIRYIIHEETKWTFDLLKDIASKFNTRNEFRVGNPNAYNAALRKKIMDDITVHMGDAKNKKSDTEDFIKKAKSIHGDKFDYSKSEYKNTNTPLTIICPIHGEFDVIPKEHYYNTEYGGCTKCSKRYKKTTEDFITDAKKIHGDKYSYEKTIFKKAVDSVIITCPIHGDFEQIARQHIRGMGCPSCGGTKKLSTDEFIEKAKQVHGDKYTYDNVDYKNTKEDVIITCPKHGDFKQRPAHHLRGSGCHKCIESLGEKNIQSILDKNNIN